MEAGASSVDPAPAGPTDRSHWEAYVREQFSSADHPLLVLQKAWDFALPLYSRILSLAPPPARILEVGTGSGLHLAWLGMNGYQVTGVDYSESIIDFARDLAKEYGFAAKLEVADAFELTAYHDCADLVFSTGMIEHWTPSVIEKALGEQARCAPIVVAEIPTRHTRFTGTVTDETFYSPRDLKRMFRGAGLTPEATFGWGGLPQLSARLAVVTMPPILHRIARDRFGKLAMAIACVGRRNSAPSLVST